MWWTLHRCRQELALLHEQQEVQPPRLRHPLNSVEVDLYVKQLFSCVLQGQGDAGMEAMSDAGWVPWKELDEEPLRPRPLAWRCRGKELVEEAQHPRLQREAVVPVSMMQQVWEQLVRLPLRQGVGPGTEMYVQSVLLLRLEQ
eukprot:gene25217-65845_t